MEPFLLIGLLLILVLPTFLMSRRQRAKMTEITRLQDSLAVGDRVVTTAGQHALVADLRGDLIDLEIAPGVITTWEKISIVRVVSPATPEPIVEVDEFTDRDVDNDR